MAGLANHGPYYFRTQKISRRYARTELGYMAKIKPEFDKRGAKFIGYRPIYSTIILVGRATETQGFRPHYPMVADVAAVS